jgi:hypothetical protein
VETKTDIATIFTSPASHTASWTTDPDTSDVVSYLNTQYTSSTIRWGELAITIDTAQNKYTISVLNQAVDYMGSAIEFSYTTIV